VTERFSAIILAGGRSARMGSPKAELKLGNQTLLERTVRELRPAFDDIVIVAAPTGPGSALEGQPDIAIIRDDREYEGPLPALARGLRAIHNDAAFVCSCDLPLLKREVAGALCAMLDSYDAVIPEIAGLVQPLHAVYRKRCVVAIDSMVTRGEKRLTKIVESLSVRWVGESELRSIDPELHSFLNVNTPEDYQRALQLRASTRT
jgi:molybdopterin-guanine dinucleotide biosynthesis protein A